MIITRPRDWARIKRNLDDIDAKRIFIMGCGQCATVANTGGEKEILQAKAILEQQGRTVTGWAVGEVACHLGATKLAARKSIGSVEDADAVLVLACGAGVQTVADAVSKPVFPGLESAFLGNVIRHGIFEERCQMCGDCVLDETAAICPVTTCPKGLLNGPCGGMWNGNCEVLRDRECTHVRIQRRLAEQGRQRRSVLPPKDFSKKLKPGSINLRTGNAGRKGDSDE
ncbi:MAG: methylenetetrahydrofolate reductase C-terminal domain-containing protein [Coriobacteriia bacterium]|nr:methylenetetrahydrofolate reductase C-terminal domain-containing protein [Coriobacteriia bacterium]